MQGEGEENFLGSISGGIDEWIEEDRGRSSKQSYVERKFIEYQSYKQGIEKFIEHHTRKAEQKPEIYTGLPEKLGKQRAAAELEELEE